MPFVPIPNVVKVEFVQAWNGQTVANVVHFHSPASWDAGKIQTLLAECATWWGSNIASFTSHALRLNLLRGTDQTSQTGLGIEIPVTTNNVGAVQLDSVPNNVSVAVKLTSDYRGRSYRGRWYFAGLVGTSVVANVVGQGPIDALKNAFDALIAGPNSNDAELVIASRVSLGSYRTEGIWSLVTGCSVDNIIDSQRRRLPGRGV